MVITRNHNTYMSVYEVCQDLQPDDSTASQADQVAFLLQCVGNSNGQSIDTFFLLYASCLVFLMQAGFAMLCAGCVQFKNVQNTMLKNLLDACGAALGFYSVGFAFAYGGSDYSDSRKTFIGTENFFLIGVEDLTFWLFQFAFAATSATIVAGTLAERCQMAAYLCYSIAVTGFLYPVVCHAVWSPQGFLNAYNQDPLWGVGVVDFAGSSVVHLTGGTTALIATYALGPRRGRFYDHRGKPLETPVEFPGHSAALRMLGAFILWFGWYGFNTGSALSITGPNQNNVISLVAVNTTLSAASACVSALVAHYYLDEKKTGEGSFSLTSAMNGCLGGLVSITGGCGLVEPWAAVITGCVAGLLYLTTSKLLIRLRIDDAVDAIPVHMTNGAWGTLSVGLFASADRVKLAFGETNDTGLLMGGSGTLLGCQIVGILFVIGWVAFVMFPFFYLLNYLGWLRSAPVDEVEGLDSRYHDKVGRPSADLVRAMSMYGHGNERLRQNIHSFEENERQSDNACRFTADSGLRRSTDTFEESGRGQFTPTEQRFTADSGGGSQN